MKYIDSKVWKFKHKECSSKTSSIKLHQNAKRNV